MIDGFTQQKITVDGVTLSVHIGGDGPPLVLLHGYPQNHMTWARVAPGFAKTHTCIIPDLRGYGESDAPMDDPAHETYSKRRMARDIIGILDALGYEGAAVLGHDRGARVAYRMALDHPERVHKLGIIEIVPTGDFWADWSADLAMKAYHWTFLAQDAPLPERMIGADPVAYIDWTLESWTLDKSLAVFSPDALASYRLQAQDPEHLHGMCADYRAGATFDRALDEADKAAGRQITCPVRFLYAEGGFPAQTGDPAAVWRSWAADLTTRSCVSGHFAMEENPQAVLDCFTEFFEA
ncbi:alpha/beta fold hydrolase [Litoreibacter roseus]|uniref:Haloacetate dehalogenase n=1 Tax=Litoreibacter roseus TaxID=2601869 RepID=A0A6N6JM84_9RHOB|nr:alpha/beta hydrolase [Litoreibacter roseus]GFE66302.1 haloacetate dehalogenase [Litoreibacter roseus]